MLCVIFEKVCVCTLMLFDSFNCVFVSLINNFTLQKDNSRSSALQTLKACEKDAVHVTLFYTTNIDHKNRHCISNCDQMDTMAMHSIITLLNHSFMYF